MTPTRFIRLLAICTVLAGTLSLPADETPKPDARDAEIAKLKAKVQEQAQEITRLKAELELTRARPFDGLKLPPGTILPIPSLPAQPETRVPPDWQPREFNGATFYLVPVSTETAARRGTVVSGTLLPKSALTEKK